MCDRGRDGCRGKGRKTKEDWSEESEEIKGDASSINTYDPCFCGREGVGSAMNNQYQ